MFKELFLTDNSRVNRGIPVLRYFERFELLDTAHL